jgi:hypothetical protein
MTQDAFRQEKRRLETAFVQCLAAVPLDVIPEQAHMRSMAKQFSAASESVVEAKGVDAVGGSTDTLCTKSQDELISYQHVFATVGTATITGTLLEQAVTFGDALTRVIMSSHIHGTGSHPTLTLTMIGVQPACGDFHAQMNLGSLIGKVVDNETGVNSKGTHRFLRAITRRNAADGNWKSSFAPNERFLRDVVSVHAVGFAMKHWGMTSVKDKPARLPALSQWQGMSDAEKQGWFESELEAIILKTWSFSTIRNPPAPAQRQQRVVSIPVKVLVLVFFSSFNCDF